jgi:DNA-binding LacI/PurR family transcriptional regulator
MIRSANPDDVCVTYDDEGGGRLAVEHLVAVGRRRIAYVTGPRHHHSASARFTGWERALTDAGLPPVRPDLAFGAWSEEWGRQAALVLAAEVGLLLALAAYVPIVGFFAPVIFGLAFIHYLLGALAAERAVHNGGLSGT